MVLFRNGQTDVIIILHVLLYSPTTHKNAISLSGDTLPPALSHSLSIYLSICLTQTNYLISFRLTSADYFNNFTT
jgi:hypothetical protein